MREDGLMASVTYYVALPFTKNEEGELCPLEAVECPSAAGAKTRAQALAAKHGGAVAFSRTGDPQAGEFSDAVELGRFGAVPADLEAASGAS